jgi:hypothetical protein
MGSITTHSAVSQEHAHKGKEWFSDDELIEAYNLGKDYYKHSVMQAFAKNLEKAQELCEEMYETLSSVSIEVKSVHLKDGDFTNFSAIFVIPAGIFLDFDQFSEVNSIVRQKVTQAEGISLSYLLMPFSEAIDKEAMIADGYNYSFIDAEDAQA